MMNTSVIRFHSAQPDLLDHEYLYAFLRSPSFQAQVNAFVTGGAQPNFGPSHLKQMTISLPLLAEQRRVAHILSAYDDLMENNRRRMGLLENAARSLYQEWFVRLRFPGHEHTSITHGLPEDWMKYRISEFGEVITGKTPSTKDADNYGGDIPFIKTPDMHGNVFVVSTEAALTEKGANSQSGKFVPKNTLLVSCIGTVGVVSITSEPSQFNQQINAVVPFEDSYCCYCFFAFKDLKKQMEAIGGGATMANVNKGKFERLEILKPAMPLLREFHDFCSPLFEQIKVLQVQNQKLRVARDLLLPRLMSGEIMV
jgi:type I restriction enzyme S subunit